MRKKIFTITALAVVVTASAFSLDLSAGAGASVSSTSWKLSVSALGTTSSVKDAIVPFGAKAYVDATYVQASVGYIMSLKATLSGTGVTTTSYDNKMSYLTFAVLGKYPFKTGPVTVFPLLGAEYDLNLSHGDPDYFEGSQGLLASPSSSDYNQLWLKGGVGVDVALGSHFYIRPEGLYGFKLLTSNEKSVRDALNSSISSGDLIFSTFDFSILFGYKL